MKHLQAFCSIRSVPATGTTHSKWQEILVRLGRNFSKLSKLLSVKDGMDSGEVAPGVFLQEAQDLSYWWAGLWFSTTLSSMVRCDCAFRKLRMRRPDLNQESIREGPLLTYFPGHSRWWPPSDQVYEDIRCEKGHLPRRSQISFPTNHPLCTLTHIKEHISKSHGSRPPLYMMSVPNPATSPP